MTESDTSFGSPLSLWFPLVRRMRFSGQALGAMRLFDRKRPSLCVLAGRVFGTAVGGRFMDVNDISRDVNHKLLYEN